MNPALSSPHGLCQALGAEVTLVDHSAVPLLKEGCMNHACLSQHHRCLVHMLELLVAASQGLNVDHLA